MNPWAWRTESPVALVSNSISSCCLAGSTVNTLMRMTGLSFMGRSQRRRAIGEASVPSMWRLTNERDFPYSKLETLKGRLYSAFCQLRWPTGAEIKALGRLYKGAELLFNACGGEFLWIVKTFHRTPLLRTSLRPRHPA